MALQVPALSPERPYPGLRPFDEPDHAFFFGRAEQYYSLYLLVDRCRFATVIGNSGSGKSSLVRAGLLPLLKQESEEGKRSGNRQWLCKVMRPGESPLTRLVKVFQDLCADADKDIEAARRERVAFDLRRSSAGVDQALEKINRLGDATLLLVVDQFEEIFRYATGAKQARDPRAAALAQDEATQFVQLLLALSRTRVRTVHVLLTMRSDFIGDCARFRYLPEAVSAAQFLVPSLTRDQLEEVVCGPIEKAGKIIREQSENARELDREPTDGAVPCIDPALVQRLLNDSSDESDQLPILQHCMMRLWERAGKTEKASGSAADADASIENPLSEPGARAERGRHLNLDHYADVGRIGGALSQHANDIMWGLQGRELAVEQVFRALSEVDKEGRAIRRAIPFAQLIAEVAGDASDPAIPEGHVGDVLDRFRADDCSFLTPSSSAVEKLQLDSTIDVGHEALLRRWEKVSGKADSAQTDAGSKGWLRAEEHDGQQYRVLLAALEGDSKVPGRIERWLRWWKSPPRTRAWAERYGGQYDHVKRLLKESRAHKWYLIGGMATAASLAFLAVGYFGIGYYQRGHRMAHMQHETDKRFRYAAQSLMAEVLKTLQAGRLSVDGATSFMKTAEKISDQVQEAGLTPDNAELKINLLLTASDITTTLGQIQRALEQAQDARNLAERAISKNPDDTTRQQLVYFSSWRIADALVALSHNNLDQALQDYRGALGLAEKLDAKVPDDGTWQREMNFTHGKIGDCLALKNDPLGALSEYREGVRIMQAVADKKPGKADWQRDLASSISRVGQALKAQNKYSEALEQYHLSLKIRMDLVANNPDDNDAYRSNLALSYAEIGEVLEQLNEPDRALATYRKGLDIRELLVDKDPGNGIWQNYLAILYQRTGNLQRKQGKIPEASEAYGKEVSIRQLLAIRDVNNVARQQSFLSTAEASGDFLVEQKRLDDALKTYRLELSALERLVKQQSTNTTWKFRQASSLSKIGDVLVVQAHGNDALAQYQQALTILEQLIANNNPVKAEWEKLRDSIKDKMQTQASVR